MLGRRRNILVIDAHTNHMGSTVEYLPTFRVSNAWFDKVLSTKNMLLVALQCFKCTLTIKLSGVGRRHCLAERILDQWSVLDNAARRLAESTHWSNSHSLESSLTLFQELFSANEIRPAFDTTHYRICVKVRKNKVHKRAHSWKGWGLGIYFAVQSAGQLLSRFHLGAHIEHCISV
jgi:hypothetical protein